MATKDSIIPVNLDYHHHTLFPRGEGNHVTWVAKFYYEDGSVREYDGSKWKLVSPSYDFDPEFLDTEQEQYIKDMDAHLNGEITV